MAQATINGKPSVYLTPEMPTPVSHETHITDAVRIATEMVAETQKPESEWTDEDYLNDPETVASLNAWYEEREAEFWNDPEAVAKYDEWVTEQAELDAEMERKAEEWENSQLGEAYIKALNGSEGF